MAEKQVSEHTPIVCLQENPKRKGSQAHERYEKYKSAKTVGEALQLGAVKGDIPNDMKKGHIKMVEGVGADGQAAAPHPPPAAGQEPVASSSSASPVKRGVVEVAGIAEDSPAAKRQAVQVPLPSPLQAVQVPALNPLRPAEPSPAVKPVQPVQPVQPLQPVQPVQSVQPVQLVQPLQPVQPVQSVQPAQPPQLPAVQAVVSAVDSSAGAAVDVSSEAASAVSSATLTGTVSTPQDTVPTPQGRKMPYEADLSFAKLDGKPMKFVKRVMGEAKKLLSERGLGESKSEGLHFSLKDRDNLSKYAVTVRDLNQDGKLYKDLERLGLDASIDLELSLPDGYPLSPPFARVVYPQLTGGFVFQHGGICFEPLTEKGWAPSMTLPSLCIAIKAILDFGDVRVAGPGNKELRSVQGYTEDGARKDSQMISRAHNGGDSRTYQNVKNLKS